MLSELQELVAEVGTDPLRASALAAEGAVAAGEGDPETARLPPPGAGARRDVTHDANAITYNADSTTGADERVDPVG